MRIRFQEIRANKEVVLAAVKQTWAALQFASEELPQKTTGARQKQLRHDKSPRHSVSDYP